MQRRLTLQRWARKVACMHAVTKAPVAVEPEDMPRPPADTVQVTFRVPSGWLLEADTVADLLSRPGMRASRTDAFRAAIAKGFEVLRAESDPPAEPAPVAVPSPSTSPKTSKARKR